MCVFEFEGVHFTMFLFPLRWSALGHATYTTYATAPLMDIGFELLCVGPKRKLLSTNFSRIMFYVHFLFTCVVDCIS